MTRCWIALLACALLAGACTVIDATPQARPDATARWALLPFANHTETPLAASRAESIAESVLRSRGVAQLTRHPASAPETLFEPAGAPQVAAALDWARQQGARYAVTGAVDEWRYKVGVDGEPAVGVQLQVVELDSGAVVWSGVGAKSGWSRESLAGVAQKLMRELVDRALAGK